MLFPPFEHWVWWVPVWFIGTCIGSFLNVVIYRVPLGLSVNEPKRSFCPACKKPIPMARNIPLVSWLLLRGKCADCGAPIAFRYFAVELLTGLLFIAAWLAFPPQAALFLFLLLALLVAITFIDAEHLIIPPVLTWIGAGAGLAACAVWPRMSALGGIEGTEGTWLDGLKGGVIGWIAGYAGLWAVVLLGKLAFGKKAMRFESPVPFELREGAEDEPILFVIDGEEISWWDIFYRKTDRLVIDAKEILVNGRSHGGGTLVIRELEIELPDAAIVKLEDVKSVSGTAVSVVIPREAMGMGDVHLLGMIGAFFGWTGVLFALFSSSIFALVAALVGRIGFGKQLPYGPFLALGAVAWMFGGWKLWRIYTEFLGPVGGW